MLSLQNGLRLARLGGNINAAQSGQSLPSWDGPMTDEITIEATDAAASFVDLLPIAHEGFVSLEASRIRVGGNQTPALSNTFKLQKKIAAAVALTVGITNASTTFTSTATGLLVGQAITGTGIPANTTIATVTATGGTLSQAATATNATVAATIPAGSVGDISTTVAVVASAGAQPAAAIGLAPITGGPPVPFLRGDQPRLVLVAVTSLGIGRKLLPSISFTQRKSPGLGPGQFPV